MNTPKFDLGRLMITPNALSTIDPMEIAKAISRLACKPISVSLLEQTIKEKKGPDFFCLESEGERIVLDNQGTLKL